MRASLRDRLKSWPRLYASLRSIRDVKRRALRRREGEKELRRGYLETYGRDPDIDRPHGFSDKVFRRLVLMNRSLDTRFTRFADKYLVREYVAQTVGHNYLSELYWQGLNPAEIPFDRLPKDYVIKTNHGSGYNIIVNGPIDRDAVIDRLRSWQRENYYWRFREYQYYDIRPRILIEEYLDDGQDGGPLDYRIWCFDGRVPLIQVDNHRHDINAFYDGEWNRLDLYTRDTAPQVSIPKPANLDEMIAVATALSADFDFVRVDLFNLNGRICFGEMTFTPSAGRRPFKPEHWDTQLGDQWTMTA